MKRIGDDEELSFKAGEGVLLAERPELLCLVGLICGEWARVEQELAFLYDYLFAQKGKPVEFGHPVDGLGVATFYSIESNLGRKSMLSLAIEWRMGSSAVKEFDSKVWALLKTAIAGRNRVAHSRMFVSVAYPEKLIFYARDGNYYAAGKGWLEGVVKNISEAGAALAHFHHKTARVRCKKSRASAPALAHPGVIL